MTAEKQRGVLVGSGARKGSAVASQVTLERDLQFTYSRRIVPMLMSCSGSSYCSRIRRSR